MALFSGYKRCIGADALACAVAINGTEMLLRNLKLLVAIRRYAESSMGYGGE